MTIKQNEFDFAIERIGRLKIQAAFQQSTFVYGTQGNGSALVLGLKRWSEKTDIAPINIFEPGRRVQTYLNGDYQMMDLYYGQAGTTLHNKRDPIIAEFVHYCMGFEGPFQMFKSGRDEYLMTFKTGIEGWDNRSPSVQKYNGLTATKEMSRIIRWGIEVFGGTLIFEGKDVYYSQVFDPSAPRVGDTDLEARELFKYFKPGAARVPFGKGTLVFQWNGKETIPTKNHFITNWCWNNNTTHQEGNFAKGGFDGRSMMPIWNNFMMAPLGM